MIAREGKALTPPYVGKQDTNYLESEEDITKTRNLKLNRRETPQNTRTIQVCAQSTSYLDSQVFLPSLLCQLS